MARDFGIVEALDAADVAACRELFIEYRQGLGVSLCFQGLDRELARLPGDYARPRGRLLIARIDGAPAGCVALRAISEARMLGYRALKLDTLPSMGEAQKLYAQLGFVDTAPCNDNPIGGVRFLALDLAPRA